MARRHRVAFDAEKKVPVEVDVDFNRKDGSKAHFRGHQDVKKVVPVSFLARPKRK